jgi:hypothetical protein
VCTRDCAVSQVLRAWRGEEIESRPTPSPADDSNVSSAASAAPMASAFRLVWRHGLVHLRRLPSPLGRLFGANFGFAFGVLLSLARDRFGALAAIPVVPLARDFRGEIAIAKAEGKSKSERDCSK